MSKKSNKKKSVQLTAKASASVTSASSFNNFTNINLLLQQQQLIESLVKVALQQQE
ncbi:16496_t:CDS:1, partial [Cetraspora pellucida]